MKVLLERGHVNLDKLYGYGHTPLSLAARDSHEGVVALLQPRKAVTSNTISELRDTAHGNNYHPSPLEVRHLL